MTLVANLPPVSTTQADWWQNLPLVSLIPVVHFDLRIYPRIFEKILSVIFRGLGEGDS
jgi:hypothetical protein